MFQSNKTNNKKKKKTLTAGGTKKQVKEARGALNKATAEEKEAKGWLKGCIELGYVNTLQIVSLLESFHSCALLLFVIYLQLIIFIVQALHEECGEGNTTL